MATDDLDAPLGGRRSKQPRRRDRLRVLPVVAGLLTAIFPLALLWVAFVDDPLGGEPVAVTGIESPLAKVEVPPASKASAGKAHAETHAPDGAEQTVTIIDGKSGARRQVAVRGGNAPEPPPAATLVDARLREKSAHGMIPRVAPDGARPLDVYARASPGGEARGRIAVVVSGLGIGANITAEALSKLPETVTLAFPPYGGELSRWVDRARGGGHEVLLQLPMEPLDYPDNDPGPHALLTTLSKEQNLDRLHWALSRVQGYVGVTSFMGARFTATEPALAPVLADLSRRGLVYLDDGHSARSVAQKVANSVKLPFLRADIVLDARPSWAEIDSALERLEKLAIEQGHAVGIASAQPVAIERIARWAKAAEGRGVKIVPLSAIAARQRQS